MTIYDQFDIFSNNDLSGSYTDDIVVSFSGSSILDRKFIGTKTNKISYNTFSSFDLAYSDLLLYLSGAGAGRNKNFKSHICFQETIFDSLVPSPIDYHIKNGFEPILRINGIPGSTLLNKSDVPVSGALFINFASPGAFSGDTAGGFTIISGTTTASLVDECWFASFPFESKYSTLLRTVKTSDYLSKFYTVRFGSDTGVATSGRFVLFSPVQKNFFPKTIVAYTKIYPKTTDYDGVLPLIPIETSRSFVDLVVKGRVSDSPQTVQDSIGNQPGSGTLVPSFENSYKLYFGVGRKMPRSGRFEQVDYNSFYFRNMPFFTDWAGNRNDVNILEIYGFNTEIAGWKYGLYSALPSNTKLVFRRNRFGQFRDVLEQRIFTKLKNSAKNTTITSPVTITFVSGTDSYVTSNNDLTLNLRDSGIYRKDYTSGKPFADNN